MYKFSKYTREYIMDDIHIFYNMISDSIILVTPEIFNIIANNITNLHKIENIHPDLFARLLQSKSIIKTGSSASDDIVQIWKDEDNNPTQVKITIIPTLQCNLRCWYCYENHNTTAAISNDTINSIKQFIELTAMRPSIRKIIVDFFGGEPLLYFDTCVKPIVSFAEKICKIYSKSLGIAFTTNGVLLTNEKCDFLYNINATTSFQITLDGNEESHNAVRFLKGGIGTYRIIMQNIAYAVSKKLQVSIRFNYTHKNHVSYKSTIDELLKCFGPELDKNLIDFSFHKVWQEQDTAEIESSMSSHRDAVAKDGFTYNIPIGLGSPSRCYADNPNDVVFNYNGDVYKCTARDFTSEQSEGKLQENGTILWNDRNVLRKKIMYGPKYCHDCTIFPICHGGCTQKKMEHPEHSSSCYFEYTDDQKEYIVKNRVIELLRQYVNISNYNY